jgi:hypothetical protein
VGNGSAIERDRDHRFLGSLATLADAVWHFAGLAQADSDPALAISNHNDAAKRECSTTLVDLGDAVDANQTLFELIRLFFVSPTA